MSTYWVELCINERNRRFHYDHCGRVFENVFRDRVRTDRLDVSQDRNRMNGTTTAVLSATSISTQAAEQGE